MLKIIKPQYTPPRSEDHTRNGCLPILILMVDILLILAVMFQGLYALAALLRLMGY